ncbi:hypothetical protein LCH21_02935 [Patescibacteria group bacterium]|nr:hypothetical protein [Patescibacteria group bacterium]
MTNKDEDKLLEVLTDRQFANAPLRDVVKHLYFQVIQSQVLETKLRVELTRTNKKLDMMHDALSSIMFMRSGFLRLRYNSRTSEITVEKYYRIDFSNTIENDLLKTMFVIKSGKPRATKWQCTEVAESFRKKGNESLDTPRKVYEAAHRIKTRLHDEMKIDTLSVKGKEFFWFYPN